MKFFFDRNMCVRTTRMLRVYEGEAGHTVVHLNDRFAHDTPDEKWLRALADEDPKWIVVAGDGRIVKNKVQMAVLAEVNLTYFLMVHPWMTMSIEDSAWRLIKVWPEIVGRAQVKTPTIFEVKIGKSIKIEEKGPTRQWRIGR